MVWQSCYAVLVWSLCISSKAQTVSWSTTVGTELYDYSRAVVSNSQGEIFIAGASRGQMAENGTWDEIDTTMDAWVMKFSSDGNLLWTLGTPPSVRSDAASAASARTRASRRKGAVEISVIWLDMTTGAVVQRADVATPSHTYPKGPGGRADGEVANSGRGALERAPELVVDQSDNIFLVGYTGGSLNGQNAGSNDIFVMKLDPYGDRLWTWQTGTAQDDRGHSIQLDTTGNIFVGGSVGSRPDMEATLKTPKSQAIERLFLVLFYEGSSAQHIHRNVVRSAMSGDDHVGQVQGGGQQDYITVKLMKSLAGRKIVIVFLLINTKMTTYSGSDRECGEREALMGFPVDYTRQCAPKAEQKGEHYEDIRMSMIGNSWHVGV
ncbi:unnamed protein product [Durusdinium trenchii]|uniref:Uncharacterized protein n=1 Tax=Durusdinium trenchii TaxID=1381693 RepID=A0ABP0QXF5_9DINO